MIAPMDRFEDMRCFVQVAESQSVTGAARKLGLAPSAVSRRLRDLEARLGVQLLTRTTRQMSLTEAGETFSRRARALLDELDAAEAEVSDSRLGLSGQLRIAAPLSFGLAYLTPIVTGFMAQHPKLRLDLDLSDRRVDLVGEGFDLAVRIGRLEDSSLIARRIWDIRMQVCAAPAFLAAHGTPQTPEELRSLPAICYSGVGRGDIWRYTDRGGRDGSVQLAERLRVNNGDMGREAAIAGLGVVILPAFLTHRALAEGALVEILGDHRWTTIAVHAVYPETRHLPARTRAFIDHLREGLGPWPPWETPPKAG